MDLGRRDARRVGHRRREGDVVRLVGQVLGDRAQFAPWPRWALTWAWWSGPQYLLAGSAGERRIDRTTGGRQAPPGATDEAAGDVGLVELERLDGHRTGPASSQRLVEPTGDLAKGCIISRLPTRPGGSPNRPGAPGSPRSAEGGACRSRWPRGRPPWPTRSARRRPLVQVAPVARPRASVSCGGRGRRDQPRAECDRLRPVGQVGRRLGALVAAGLARAPLDAWSPAVVRRRVDRVELRPPVPAKLRLAAGHLQPGRPDRERRHRRVLGSGGGRVAAQAGQPNRGRS